LPSRRCRLFLGIVALRPRSGQEARGRAAQAVTIWWSRCWLAPMERWWVSWFAAAFGVAGPGPVGGAVAGAGEAAAASRRPLTRIALLTRSAEQHPAQRHHPLLQRGQLLPLRGHRPRQSRVLRRQPRVLRLQQLRTRTPKRRLPRGSLGTSWRDHHAKAGPPPRSVFSTAPACRISATGSPNTYHRRAWVTRPCRPPCGKVAERRTPCRSGCYAPLPNGIGH